jgi:hypothetical protein
MYEGNLTTLSNRQTWGESVGVIDTDTNEPIDISTASEIAVQVAPQIAADYGGYGSQNYTNTPLLTATLSNGKVQHVQLGVFAFAFTQGEIRGLPGGVYNVEIAIHKDDEVESLFLGTIGVREGVVTIGG